MAISRLQGDGAALGMSGDHARPGSQRAERGRGSLPTASPAFAACGLATGLDPKREEEEASNLGPLVLDSDSDDSVDRDIEEAIQEYLRAKSGAAPPPAAGDAARRCRPEPALSGAPAAPCPPNPAAGPSPVQGSASPLSVSSDDSFEQSIQAEIEQFLSEKRLHETQKGDLPADRKADPGDSLARATCRPGREPPLKAPQQDLPGTGKEFVFRKLPRSAKASALPRGLRCKVTAEPAAAATAGPPAEAAPGKGRVRRGAGSARKGRQPRSVALVHEEPDSSSDDGIEEAIRLYQRERRREVRGHQGPLPTEEKGPVAPAHSLRGPWPEALSKTPSKKKPAAPKATDLGPGGPDSEHPPRPPRETTAPVPPGSAAAESLGVDGSPCRADTSAELMCAEAILDISKTILPAPVDGGERPPPTSPLRQGPDGNSSAVDSDDSIEQEIRTFLALKAQSGGPLPHTETCARPAHSPPLPPSLSAPAPDTPDPSPGCRRRCSRMPCMPRQPRDTAEMQDAERGQGQRDGVPRAGLALPWPDLSPQSRLQSTWVLGPEGRDVAAWRGGLSSQREKGLEGQALGSPSLATDSRRGLPFAGFSPLLSTQLFHFGKSMPWGAKQASLFSPGLGLPLQGPSFSAFREAQATRNPVFGSPRLLVKEGGRWPCRKPRAGLSLSDRRGSGPEESVLDLRFGRRGLDRDDEEPEALGSDASELSDTSVEEGGGPTAQGPVLQL
ncbi:hypothetical protein E5288_WYG003965 [Bos mutus]|uniref:Protein phosphatase 1 regulatory subunit 26 N-terminal domain-containing protein n=1 Tax=Bos mutus TaxID=72004 RepID=A0A6B0SGC4_9CETA|nr:hypothetical protein [Bos mutus]